MTGLHATINPMKSACINDARSIEILKQKIQNFVSCNTVPTIYNPNVDKFIATEYCKAFNKYAQPRTVKKTIQRGAEHFLKIIIDRSGFTPQSNLNAEESFFFSISTKFGAELEFARGQVDL
ncbi:MAG: hypothetical protein FJY58_10360 [Betaproteobacteria bacterium]|nr:hypothetical protein [Betaproteobacteria bacterium]